MNHDRLEQALRDARQDFGAVRTAPDAWQEQQRRLAGDRSHRSRLVLGAVAAAAAVVLVLVTGAALLAGGRGPDAGPPASGPLEGGEDPWASENLLGPPVELERLDLDGTPTVHEAVLTDTTGDGPVLCDRYAAVDGSAAAGGCTPRAENADDDAVAVDWLSGTEGGGDLRGLVLGVDERVELVVVWTTDGRKAPLPLSPSGWESTQLGGRTLAADGPRPARVVAFDQDGRVLQSVDLRARFGETWLQAQSACEAAPPSPDAAAEADPPGATVSFGTDDAHLSLLLPGGRAATACVDGLDSTTLAGRITVGKVTVVLLAPEAAAVELRNGDEVVDEVSGLMTTTAPWSSATLDGSGSPDPQRLEVVVYDDLGTELDREFVRQPTSP